MKYIYALNIEDKNELIEKGFTFVMEAKLDMKIVYVFENKGNYERFKTLDTTRFLVSDIFFI